MKKMLLALVALVALSFAHVSPAAAQGVSVSAAVVKIPFSFIAGQRVMPAGSYRIAPSADDWSLLTITNLDGKEPQSAFVQTVSNPGAEPFRGEAHVKFAAYAGHAFLREVAVPGRDPRQVILTPATAQRTLVKLNLTTAEPADVAK